MKQLFENPEHPRAPAHHSRKQISAQLGGEEALRHPWPLTEGEAQSEQRNGHPERRRKSRQRHRLAHGQGENEEQQGVNPALELVHQTAEREFVVLLAIGQLPQLGGKTLRYVFGSVVCHGFFGSAADDHGDVIRKIFYHLLHNAAMK